MNRRFFTYAIFIVCILLVFSVTISGITPLPTVKANFTKVTLQIKNSSLNVTKSNLSTKNTTSANVSGPVYNMNLGIMSPGGGQSSSFSSGSAQSSFQAPSSGTNGGSSSPGSEGNLNLRPISPSDSSGNGGTISGRANDLSPYQPVISIPTFVIAGGVDSIAGLAGNDRLTGASDTNDNPPIPANPTPMITSAPAPQATPHIQSTPYLWACKNSNSYECAEECVKDSRVCPGNNPWYPVNCDVSTSIGCICQKNPNDPECPCFQGMNDDNPNCRCQGDGANTEACAEACIEDHRSCPSPQRCEIVGTLVKGCMCMKRPNDPSCPCVPGKNDDNPNCNALLGPVNIKSCENPTSKECSDYCQTKNLINYPECNKVKSIACNDPTSKQCYDYCINQPESQWCKENIDCLNDAYSSQCESLCKENPDSYACAYCKTPAGKNDPACNDVNMCTIAPSGTMCKEYCLKHPDDLKCLPVKITTGPCSKPKSQECVDYCWGKSPLDYPECNQVKSIACSDPKSETCASYCKAKPGAYGCPVSLNQSVGSLKLKITPAIVVKLNRAYSNLNLTKNE